MSLRFMNRLLLWIVFSMCFVVNRRVASFLRKGSTGILTQCAVGVVFVSKLLFKRRT